ncbi:hypothetical protein ACFV0O_19855 [Kitasatospora sp. NPDC059577]|uniref:WXG100 family type VII secretion target n=1 Tax=Kitasatospora sp. NPDC059577 TaxID=3346873 RepID=UPI0036BFEE81
MAGETKFDAIEHQKLYDMVKDTNPTLVLSRGNQLGQAGRVLNELSAALKSHLGNIVWEGPAAESFKTWAGNLQQSAELLGKYSSGAGDAMHQAGEVLSSVKSGMPPVPPDALRWVNDRKTQKPDPQVVQRLQLVSIKPDGSGPTSAEIDTAMKRANPDTWVSETEAMAGTRELYMAHQEAIHQMEKLGQAYTAATTTLNGLGDNVVLPGTPGDDSNRGGASEYTGGGVPGGGYGGSLRSPRTNGGSTEASYSPVGGSYGEGPSPPRDPGSGQGPSTPTHASPTPPYGGGQLPPAPQDPGSVIPPTGPTNRPGTDLTSLPTVPTLPGQTGPAGPGGDLPASGPGGNPVIPGLPGGPGGTPGLPGLPGGGPIGFPVGGAGSIPAKSNGNGYLSSKGGGSIPPRTVPFGGGTSPGRSGASGLPTGTVFGAREAEPGRAGMPGGVGGMNPGMGGHGVGGSGGGGVRGGRGLTSTPGGTVGGRKGPAAGGEFTPGGTGLRNRAGAAGPAEGGTRSGQNGMMAPGVAGHGGRNGRDKRKRADYLHEDEETWTSDTPHSNPDVVE